MNFYFASGTPEFMETLQTKYAGENMILLHGQGNSILMHETEKKSKFATPRRFEVVEGRGEFEQRGFVAMHNVPVADESKKLFEESVINAIQSLKNNTACIAFRVLRPIKHEMYVIVTQWAGPASFEAWTESANFSEKLAGLIANATSVTQTMFTSKAYVTTFSAPAQQ